MTSQITWLSVKVFVTIMDSIFVYGGECVINVTYVQTTYALINVKPVGGGGGGGGGGRQGTLWGFDCLCWPWGRAFD